MLEAPYASERCSRSPLGFDGGGGADHTARYGAPSATQPCACLAAPLLSQRRASSHASGRARRSPSGQRCADCEVRSSEAQHADWMGRFTPRPVRDVQVATRAGSMGVGQGHPGRTAHRFSVVDAVTTPTGRPPISPRTPLATHNLQARAAPRQHRGTDTGCCRQLRQADGGPGQDWGKWVNQSKK